MNNNTTKNAVQHSTLTMHAVRLVYALPAAKCRKRVHGGTGGQCADTKGYSHE